MEKDNGKSRNRRQYRERTTDSVRKEDLTEEERIRERRRRRRALQRKRQRQRRMILIVMALAAVVIITAAVRGIAGHFLRRSRQPAAQIKKRRQMLPGETRQSRKPPAAKVHRKIHSKLLNLKRHSMIMTVR